MRIHDRLNINLIDQQTLPVSAISNEWQQERRICSVMLDVKGLTAGERMKCLYSHVLL